MSPCTTPRHSLILIKLGLVLAANQPTLLADLMGLNRPPVQSPFSVPQSLSGSSSSKTTGGSVGQPLTASQIVPFYDASKSSLGRPPTWRSPQVLGTLDTLTKHTTHSFWAKT